MCILPFEISSFNMKMCESVFESHCKRQCIHIFIHTGNKKFKLQKEDKMLMGEEGEERERREKKVIHLITKYTYTHKLLNKSKIKKKQ